MSVPEQNRVLVKVAEDLLEILQPKIKPLVSQSERIEEIAAEKGLSADVIRSIAASYWQQTGATAPVGQRVSCLEKYWQIFDELHTRQSSGMKSLWGLVTDTCHIILSGTVHRRDRRLRYQVYSIGRMPRSSAGNERIGRKVSLL